LDRWLRTDEQHDVVVSLDEVLHQMERVAAGETHCWKWAIIALASATSGALACNLSGTMQIGALNKCDAIQIIASFKDDTKVKPPKKLRLASPDELLKRARREKRIERAGPTLSIGVDQKRAFTRIIGFRNTFMHFEPMGLSVEVSGMTAIFERVLSIIEQVIEDGWSFRHLSDEDRKHLVRVCQDLRRVIDKIDSLVV